MVAAWSVDRLGRSLTDLLDFLRELHAKGVDLFQVGSGNMALPNDNFDTGGITGPGEYRLNDETHADLLHALAKQNFAGASPEVRAELTDFFGHPDAPYAIKRKPKQWVKVQAEMEKLKNTPQSVETTACNSSSCPSSE
jgi:hypothetical protein